MVKLKYPKIAIVGRPNVGKSSLFNRIVGSRKAIVEATSGTTRDRLHADIKRRDKWFTIVDTGGFESSAYGDITVLVLRQLNIALKEAEIIFFVTDVASGVLPQDIAISESLRKTSKPIYLIVNKVDSKSEINKTMEFFELGLGEPYPVSATNGTGIERLLDDAARGMEKTAAIGTPPSVKVAIVGKPNVGKSSYVNSILMEERVIVHSAAGTTRDAVDTDFNYKDRNYVLIDTAGIRHNPKINEPVDFYGTVRSNEAIRRSDVAIVLIDGYDGLRDDDRRIIEIIINEGKALVIAINKWDLTENIEMSKYGDMLIEKMNFIRNLPIVFISCKTRKNILASMDIIWSAYEKSKTIVGPEALAGILKSLNNTSEIMQRRIKFRYLIQTRALPPSFVLGIKDARLLNGSLKRYVENFFRKSRDFTGVPIRISYNK